jgi:hypothetical protein
MYRQERFANGQSIQGHHSGAQTILAHWHHINKGSRPFQDALTSKGLGKVQDLAQLTSEQAKFIEKSAHEVWLKGKSQPDGTFGHILTLSRDGFRSGQRMVCIRPRLVLDISVV